jgi:CubicO group peptidase (beta-lactamase class C family)
VPDSWERKVTFRQCLGHQTPFPNDVAIFTYGENPDLLRNFVLQYRWEPVPSVYTCVNFILMGIALERLEGKKIREMDPGPGFAFSAPPERSAATEFCIWRNRIVAGEVHDENCAALQGAGNAGLFGTIQSVLDAAEGLLSGDENGDAATKLQRTPLSATRTHGWERPYIGWSGGDSANVSTIGHTGFTGTGLWVDFDNRRAWTLLTNRVHPSRYCDSGILQLRRAVGDAVNA